MNDVVAWLHSPDGEEWSRSHHAGVDEGGQPARHSTGIFASVKHDHECHGKCAPSDGYTWLDKQIREDIARYGMNGVPGGQLAALTSPREVFPMLRNGKVSDPESIPRDI